MIKNSTTLKLNRIVNFKRRKAPKGVNTRLKQGYAGLSRTIIYYSSFKYLVGLDVWALTICQETLMAVMAMRLRKARSSGRAETLDSGAITENKTPVSHQDKGSPKSMANPMAYTNSLLMR